FPLAVAGAVSIWRRGLRTSLALLLVPILLPLVAAHLHAYPFGGYRVMVYTTPALALLIAERLPWQPGAERGARSAGRLRAPHFTLRALCRYGVLASSLLPLAWSVYRVLEPWNRADCAGAAKYVMSCLQPGDGV